MRSFFGKHFTLTLFGASHDKEIGMTLTGIPAGKTVDLQALQDFLQRRAPGNAPWSSPRRESDIPLFRSGIAENLTTGECITAVICNKDVRKSDYEKQNGIPRPGHADFTAWTKYGMDFDMSGGGPFSGRMTAPLCIAGGLCKQWLAEMGIVVSACILQVGNVRAGEIPSDQCSDAMLSAILAAKEAGDSLGGRVGCTITGVPAGIGGPMFGGLEGYLSYALFSIPAVKAVGFGAGHDFSGLLGSQANDAFIVKDGRVQTQTNHCGGILGGITTGMPIQLDVTFKPTPSIAKQQRTIDLRTLREVPLQIEGRHDPCIVPRAVPVVEAAAALAIYDLILDNQVK